MTDGLELMRLFAQAHMSLRARREQRRADVTDADGDVRAVTEDGQEHTRVMIFGPVAPRGSPIARRERRAYTPQDAEQNWAACTHTRPGGKAGGQGRRDRTVRAGCGAGQRAGGIQLGKRQAEELTIGAAVGFDAFYASPAAGAVPAGDRAAAHLRRVSAAGVASRAASHQAAYAAMIMAATEGAAASGARGASSRPGFRGYRPASCAISAGNAKVIKNQGPQPVQFKSRLFSPACRCGRLDLLQGLTGGGGARTRSVRDIYHSPAGTGAGRATAGPRCGPAGSRSPRAAGDRGRLQVRGASSAPA